MIYRLGRLSLSLPETWTWYDITYTFDTEAVQWFYKFDYGYVYHEGAD